MTRATHNSESAARKMNATATKYIVAGKRKCGSLEQATALAKGIHAKTGVFVSVEKASPYRKGTFEARVDSLLPDWPSFDVIAHELWADGEGGWSVNDSWHLAHDCDRDEAISHLRHRWEIFKINYAPKARVSNLTDAGFDEESPCLLEVDCIAFAEVRKGEA